MNSGPSHPEELISAAVSGEISPDERAWLDEHLAGCAVCRDTYQAFSEQRRLLGGMRREPAPRGLAPRVQHGIASGEGGSSMPWWKRPTSLAALAAAAVLVVVVGATLGIALRRPSDDLTAAEPSGSAVPASATPSGVVPPPPTPEPTATLAVTAAPSPAVTPIATQEATTRPPAAPVPPGSVVYLSLEGELGAQRMQVVLPPLVDGFPEDFESGEVIAETDIELGPPIVAELSPDGEWLAYQTRLGESGLDAVWALNLVDGTQIELGETIGGSAFLERMTWGSDGHRLAYSLTDPATGATDVWLFDSDTRDAFQMVSTGNSYAASFEGADQLWVSTAGERPASYRFTMTGAGPPSGTISDPAAVTSVSLDGVFQPMLSPDGSHAIYWRGSMQQEEGGGWSIATGGMLYLAPGGPEGPSWGAETKLFPTLEAGRAAFRSAELAWSFNSDDFAVWNTAWLDTPQPSENAPSGAFPDPMLIYFGRVSSGQLITDYPYIDLTAGGSRFPIDVEFSPEDVQDIDADIVWVTLQVPSGGTLDPPSAVLAATIAAPNDTGYPESDPEPWTGPAIYLAESSP